MKVEGWNKLLVATVIVLLWVAILALIKVLFSDSNGFEWGSVSDWLSSLGTIGTLGIAIAAYKKAPEWLAQKQYDVVHNVIEESVYNNLTKVKSSSHHLKNLFCSVSKQSIIVLNNNCDINESLRDEVYKLDSLMDEFANISYSVINSLNTIPRNGFALSNYSCSIIDILKNTNREYGNIYNLFLSSYFEVDSLIHADRQAKDLTIDEFLEFKKQVTELHKKVSDLIVATYSNNYSTDKFIVRKKGIHESIS
ncbi:hypothetical protein LVQ78_11140 [Buttiauxella sp. A2-C2_NF]|uniref:hypothetical protein n=1 Tax=Buttiauxella ferragutiae TaxID=82989 RepID=UPI001E5BA889|nr:hypothetical protein [Buttiauxella ferragutiae]MCE0826584.1 hypothetical protein [Buttiauxella ferragutiae]